MSFLIINGLGVNFAEMERSVVNTVMVQSATTTSAGIYIGSFLKMINSSYPMFSCCPGGLLQHLSESPQVWDPARFPASWRYHPWSHCCNPTTTMGVSGGGAGVGCGHCTQWYIPGAHAVTLPGHTTGVHQSLSTWPPCSYWGPHRCPTGCHIRGKDWSSQLWVKKKFKTYNSNIFNS